MRWLATEEVWQGSFDLSPLFRLSFPARPLPGTNVARKCARMHTRACTCTLLQEHAQRRRVGPQHEAVRRVVDPAGEPEGTRLSEQRVSSKLAASK